MAAGGAALQSGPPSGASAAPFLSHRAEDFAAFLPPLLLAAERVAATVAQGVHGRRRVGSGDSFWQFRRYSPGDPISRIDWRQSAKRPHAFLRENEWEAAESVWLWRDLSPSMAWGSDYALERKDQRADLLLLATGSLLLRGGERVALMGAPERPSSGRNVLLRVADWLTRQRAGTAEASLPPQMHLPRHAQVVLFGDFLYPPQDIAARLRALADQGVKGCVVRIIDPAEEDFPYRGRTEFRGLEGESPLLAPRAENLAGDWKHYFAAHRAEVAAICQRLGWHHIAHRTDRPPEALLLALYLALAGGREGQRR